MKIAPAPIQEIMWGFARSRILVTAVELSVFTHIANGRRTIKRIAAATRCRPRGISMLLNALAGLKLLRKDRSNRFALTPLSAKFLVTGRPGYLGAMVEHTKQLNQSWEHLTSAVRTGKPPRAGGDKHDAEKFFAQLVRALFNLNYAAAHYAAGYLKQHKKSISSILDIAAGSGVWSIAFAQEFRSATVTALDFPAVLKVARAYAGKFGVGHRFKYLSGDLRRLDFGKQQHDLIILGHICHSEGRANTIRLLRKSYAALRKDGQVLIADFLPNNRRTGPVMPLMFALNMLLNTTEGDVFSVAEYQKWLRAAGFKKIELLRSAPAPSPLILAAK